jgi:hypothetical protein
MGFHPRVKCIFLIFFDGNTVALLKSSLYFSACGGVLAAVSIKNLVMIENISNLLFISNFVPDDALLRA